MSIAKLPLDLHNGNRTHSPGAISGRGGRISPPAIRFGNENTANGRSQSPAHGRSPSRIVSDRPLVPARSLSNTTISEDIRSQSIDHHMQTCNDGDCACGWETYVVDHTCQDSLSDWTRVSIHNLLHQEHDNPLLRDYDSGKIRHVHLPANNMTWAQVSFYVKALKAANLVGRILFCDITTTRKVISNTDYCVEIFGMDNNMGERAQSIRDS